MTYHNMYALVTYSRDGNLDRLAEHIEQADPVTLAHDIGKMVLLLFSFIHPNMKADAVEAIFKSEIFSDTQLWEEEFDEDQQ